MTAGLPQSEEAAGPLYIINLSSSTTPMALEAPDVPELGGFAVFRSRRVEDGRDRYRLHLGYFDSQEQAEQCLPLVRDRYPAAWVALAPKDGMGSLDDTSVAQFKFIRHKKLLGNAVQPPSAAPVPAKESPIAAPSMGTVPAAAPIEDKYLKPAEMLSLLETGSSTPVPAAAAASAAKSPPHMPAVMNANQRFAVQLVWSTERPDTARIPRPAIFDAYSLYTVIVQRGHQRWYGLRLGFFNDPVSARQVALYVRSDFSMVNVVPVSARECERADEAVKTALEKETARKKPAKMAVPAAKDIKGAALTLAAKGSQTGSMTLTLTPDDGVRQAPAAATKPANDVISAKQNIKKVLDELDGKRHHAEKEKAAAKRSKQETATGGKSQKRWTSTEELLKELSAEGMSLGTENGDELSDTGVRHLSVSVVKRKSPAFGKLLSRIAGK